MTTFRPLLDKLKLHSLSGDELLCLVGNKAKLLTYEQLESYDSIFDAMGPHKALILLYCTEKNRGHWTCVFSRDNQCIEFFCSYALKPDDQLRFVPRHMRERLKEDHTHLTNLLLSSDKEIEYNDHPLQNEDPHVAATCGRWVAARLLFRALPIDDFAKKFKKIGKWSSDDIVTAFTQDYSAENGHCL